VGVYDRNKSHAGRRPNYWIDYRVDGRRYQESARTSDRRVAEQLLRQRRCEIRDGVWRPPGERTLPARPTVAEYFEQWVKERRAAGVRTVADDETRLKEYVLPAIGAMRLDEVRRRDVKAMVSTLHTITSKATSRPLAPRSINHIYGAARAMFRAAVDDELISATPCTLRVRKGELPKVEDRDPKWRSGAVFSRAEVENLISAEVIPHDRRVLYALAFFLGARFGEVAGRRWADYDRDARPLGRMSIPTQYDNKPLKAARPREAPVHPVLASILAEWRLRGFPAMFGRQPRPADWIVPRRDDGGHRAQQSTWKHLQDDLTALGYRGRRLHDLRRSLVSIARADGARDDLLRWVTHGPRSDIMDVYTTPPWDSLCEQIACVRVERRVANVVPMRAAAGAETDRFGDTGGDTTSSMPAFLPQFAVRRAGLEPAKGTDGPDTPERVPADNAPAAARLAAVENAAARQMVTPGVTGPSHLRLRRVAALLRSRDSLSRDDRDELAFALDELADELEQRQ